MNTRSNGRVPASMSACADVAAGPMITSTRSSTSAWARFARATAAFLSSRSSDTTIPAGPTARANQMVE
ncbi:MAG TPA: hypothetical protein VKY79_11560 [Actinomycetaceae bacterium]|nr:hypothetical protein [Actinomycetaceae bacterium]